VAVVSVFFEVGDETVWNPANRIARLYVGMLEAAAEVLGLPTGLEVTEPDTYGIDVARFEALVKKMVAEYANAGSAVLRMLLGAVLPPSIRVLEHAGVQFAGDTPEQREYLAEVRSMDLPMAR
jgi:hypothetical protein